MNIVCVGGGPAGLYVGILMKKADPAHRIRVIERNRPDDTFGFGVVFSDATLGNLAAADAESYAAVTRHFAHWDAIDTHVGGQVIRSRGHGFCGLERKSLLLILQERCRELGVELCFDTEVRDLAALGDADLIVAADGVSSPIRARHAAHFGPTIDTRPNRFVWLGTTYPFEAFTFYFKESRHGLFRVHAYRYEDQGSTFIVECTEDTWRRAGLDHADEDGTIAYLEEVFASELAGHRLTKNRSIWRSFPTVHNRTWHHDNIVLVGDAAHTAHFSIGSGTKLAMEDAIDLARALCAERDPVRDLGAALARYERARRPAVESLQRAAQVSLEWFENTERYLDLAPGPFTFSLLTRSLRVTHDSLRKRDPAFVATLDRAQDERARAQCGLPPPPADAPPPPPMFTPLRLRDLIVDNRVVAVSTARADTTHAAGDLHLVHLGALALGGAGLVLTGPVAVSPEGRDGAASPCLDTDEAEAALARIAAFVHAHTPARIGVVLDHAGRRARPGPGLAASALAYAPGHAVPHAMDRADMDRVRDAFVAAAGRAARAGLDMLTVHAAQGSLLAGFLSPLTNQRDDDHGGALDSRLRFVVEIVQAVRAAWPASRPLSARIPATDARPGGLTPADAVHVARALAAAGCDLIEVSAGGNVHDEQPITGRLAWTMYADRVRNEAGVVTLAIDDLASAADVNSVIAACRADLVAPARALAFDPHFVRRAAAAQGHALPWPAALAAAAGFVPRN